MANLFELSFDDPMLQPNFGQQNNDLASLLSEINAKIEQPIPGIVTMSTPSKAPFDTNLDEEFKFDGLNHLLAAQPREYGPQDTRVSVFEKFDLSKIPDEQLFPTIDSYRMSMYINKVSPPKPTVMKSIQPTVANKENASSNVVPNKTSKQPAKGKESSALLTI